MNLVNELQVSAEQDDVLTVLRKTRRLASKLGRKDILVWLDNEQDGYRGEEVPDYRKVGVNLAYNTNGFIPAGYGRLKSGIEDIPGFPFHGPIPLYNSISDLLQMLQKVSQSGALYTQVDDPRLIQSIREVLYVDPRFEDQFSFLFHLNDSQVQAIPERIKDHVLRWALALEEAGVKGGGMTFSADEKKIAESVVINFYGNVEQFSHGGSNRKIERH